MKKTTKKTKASSGSKSRTANKDKTHILTAAEILDCNDIISQRIPVPEWGGHVYVRTMSAVDRDTFEAAGADKGIKNIRARLVVATIVDRDGRRLFTDDDAEALGNKSAKTVGCLFDVSAAMNGLFSADVDELSGSPARG